MDRAPRMMDRPENARRGCSTPGSSTRCTPRAATARSLRGRRPSRRSCTAGAARPTSRTLSWPGAATSASGPSTRSTARPSRSTASSTARPRTARSPWPARAPLPVRGVPRFTPRAGAARRRGGLRRAARASRTLRARAAGVCSAIRLDGRFAHVRLRSVPAQQLPRRPLDEVLRDQRVIDASRRSSASASSQTAAGLDVPGSHLHLHLGGPPLRRPPAELPACGVMARLDFDADTPILAPARRASCPATAPPSGSSKRLERLVLGEGAA